MKSSRALKGMGFPGGGLVVLRERGFEPWSRKIPQAMEQPNLHAAAAEACTPWSPCNKRGHGDEKPTPRNQRVAPAHHS